MSPALKLPSEEEAVLLVDADMPKPQTHALPKARRTSRLWDVSVGPANSSEVIGQYLSATTLVFLPAGAKAPSPADLLPGVGPGR